MTAVASRGLMGIGDVLAVLRPDFDDVTVSRRHADLVAVDSEWELRDAGSLNGSYVNRRRIDDQRLVGGDEVQIGKYRFVYLEAAAGGVGGES